jgi:polyisoprenoid-binding protein YceI
VAVSPGETGFRRVGKTLLATAAACVLGWPAADLRAEEIDGAASRVGFTLETRWGQGLEGRFPSVRGQVDDLGGGQHRVRLVLSSRDVEMVGHPGYTRFARGRGFFDAQRWPQVEFLSDPYGPELLREGGTLGGTLRIRGRQHHESFQVAPATCDAPARACDVVATGTIDREDYDMQRWRIAIADDVRFRLRLRLRGASQ